jgi:hypothetical protein
VWAVDRLVAAGLDDFHVMWHPLTDARSIRSWWDDTTLPRPPPATASCPARSPAPARHAPPSPSPPPSSPPDPATPPGAMSWLRTRCACCSSRGGEDRVR